MWRKALALWAASAACALAGGIEITVQGEANGVIKIDLLEDVAPNHVARITALAEAGAYDNVWFHRVIGGFMAQTGDVQFGRPGGNLRYAGAGGSDLPDLAEEFSDLPFERGVVGMARSADPNSANSQFFIMFERKEHLDGLYTVVGRVTQGMEIVDEIKRGHPQSGAMLSGAPDMMVKVVATP